jgi:hypothetical protein
MISQPDRNGTIGHGAILVDEQTRLPDSLRLESDTTGSGWSQIATHPDGQQLEKTLTAAGWMFFFMAGAMRTTVFGFDEPGMIRTALKRLMASARVQGCNCLEIDAVASHTFWRIPYVSVSAHSRQIQRGAVFSR